MNVVGAVCKSLHGDVQMSGWLEVLRTKDDWKSITTAPGELSAVICLTTSMPV